MELFDRHVRTIPNAEVELMEGADHSFHVLKRSGRTDADVLAELADTIVAWISARLDTPGAPPVAPSAPLR